MTALFRINAALGDVLRTTSEPMIARIRLAWWRERLEALGGGVETPAEPRLQAADALLLSRGVRGRDLARLAAGWEGMLDPFPWSAQIIEDIALGGSLEFELAARILGASNERVQHVGALWHLVDVARHCSYRETRAQLLDLATAIARDLRGEQFQAQVRPLSMLAAVAMRDCRRGDDVEPEGTPARAWVMFKHRVSGRL